VGPINKARREGERQEEIPGSPALMGPRATVHKCIKTRFYNTVSWGENISLQAEIKYPEMTSVQRDMDFSHKYHFDDGFHR